MVMIALNTIVLMMKVSGLLLNLCNFGLVNAVFAGEVLYSQPESWGGIATSQLPDVVFRGPVGFLRSPKGIGIVAMRSREWDSPAQHWFGLVAPSAYGQWGGSWALQVWSSRLSPGLLLQSGVTSWGCSASSHPREITQICSSVKLLGRDPQCLNGGDVDG